jgi:CTD small phosphatase-like protein 2
VSLAESPGLKSRKLLVFDLDETLVHCCNDAYSGDVQIQVRTPEGRRVYTSINVRPYAVECLREASRLYEVVVFTASAKEYADAVLDYLDPTGDLVHHRLYRDDCLWTSGVYVKDLRIFSER